MNYKISDRTTKLNITVLTLCYYDKEGLLPFVISNQSGIRIFKDRDLKLLNIIKCLKKTGILLKEINIYINLYMEENSCTRSVMI